MKAKTLILMLLGAGLLWAGTLYFQNGAGQTQGASSGLLLPKLKAEVNDVRKVSLEVEGETWTFERSADGNWTDPERGDYPADRKKLDSLVLALARSERLEAKTKRPELYAELGLAEEPAPAGDPTTPPATGASPGPVKVQVFDGKDTSLGSVWIGKRRAGTTDEAYFTRIDGEPTCWLASGNLRVETKRANWLDTSLVDVAANDMLAVRIQHPDGEEVLLARPKDGDANQPLAILNLPAGQEPQSEWVTARFASALQALRMEDVAPVDSIDFSPESTVTSEFWTREGLHVTVRSVDLAGKIYATFAADANAEGAPKPYAGPVEDTLPKELDPAGATNETPSDPAAVEAQAQAITQKSKGWAYLLPSWKATALRGHMQELLKQVGDEHDPFADPGGPQGSQGASVQPGLPENPLGPDATT
ncbi:MAG TPA: DUF4340 domain-containing protein, partial [Planctomycetota bacterium]|nr:DUF4340 domain-containing protein [Planctomycetota bacterium]